MATLPSARYSEAARTSLSLRSKLGGVLPPIGRVLFTAICLLTLHTTLRLAHAEWQFQQNTPQSIRLAASSVHNSKYWLRLADEPQTDSQAERAALQNALTANPRESQAWIQLGLNAEREDRNREADFALSQAEAVDHRYLPAWTRANFAFRHDDSAQFWRSARSAARLLYDDPGPLLELADRSARNPLKALDALDAGPRLDWSYLDFLIARNRWNDALEVAGRIQAHALRKSTDQSVLSEDERRLTAFTDRLIEAGYAAQAITIWNGLATRLDHGFAPLDPQNGVFLTNELFTSRPSNTGFDWHLTAAPNIEAEWRPKRLAFLFLGRQADAGILLEQALVLPPGLYQLDSGAAIEPDLTHKRSDPSPAVSATPVWLTLEQNGQKKLSLASTPLKAGLTSAQFSIRAERDAKPSNEQLTTARLRLIYSREPGFPAFRGRVVIRTIHLKRIGLSPVLGLSTQAMLPKGDFQVHP